MKYVVDISSRADRDLREIYEYIAFELLAPENAAGQLKRLESAIMRLDSMPLRHKKYDSISRKLSNLYMMPVDNFIVFYVPDEEAHTVTIIRVMYGGRDIDEQLNN
ncbi:MAG: type II toxin-antitoxin system RelE/ParE family toxin [Lachnospiraceae bacterium]|nr:type II toxin-antitoxin system RelE/ParE family toxin [Lachnospiraceae bacterium]